MTLAKIRELVERRNQLSGKEKKELALGIRTNKKAREIAIIGAIEMMDWNLALSLYLEKS